MAPPAACLIGWPAAHSRSPIIHKHWLKTLGIAGDYRIEAVKPEMLASFLGELPARGYVGANVTMPHKEQALTLAQGDARARAVGAANTLWFDRGVLHATNTDVEGFVGNLDASAPGWDRAGGDALVLGAGGASRAVLFGLLERGVGRIHLANRTRERADALARKIRHARQTDRLGPDRRVAAGREAARQHHLARHEGPTATRRRCRRASRRCGCRRPRLLCPWLRRCCRPRGCAACRPPMDLACSCTRRSADLRCGLDGDQR